MSATSPSSFLVFGAAGHIGGPCAEHLQTRRPDAHIRVATSRREKADALRAQRPGMDVCVMDYLDAKAMRAAFDGVEAAFVVTPDFLDETAAMGNVVDAVERSASLVRLVRMTGDAPGLRDESEVYEIYPPMRKWDGGCAVQHLRARKVLSASSVPVVYLNVLAWFFQDFSNYMNSSILEQRTFVMPADRLMNYIDAGDIGRAAAELMLDPSRTQPGGTYHLTNGVDCCTFRELAGLMSEAFGEQIDFEGDEKTFLRMLGDACRSYYGRQDAPEWVLDFSRWEDAFLSTLGDDPWSNMLPEGEPLITPEQLGFAPKPFRDWLAEHREAFLGKPSASLA